MSTSSEIVDSGRLSSQNQPVRAPVDFIGNYLTLGRRETPSTATMNLFPMAETRGTAVQPETGHNQSRPMTIFYDGQVMVFNDLSPEKVKEIIMLAEKGVSKKPQKDSNFIVQDSIKIQRPQPVVPSSDLPIARKASLARFLEKRKDRISARSPYPAQSGSKEDDSKTWLGLGAQS